MPLSFELGEAFQFDWSCEYLFIGGLRRRLEVAHTKLAASRAFCLVAYYSQAHEMLFDSAVAMLGYAPMQYLLGGIEPQRNGNVSPDTSPSGVFHCTDGSFYVNSGNDRIFERLVAGVLERPDVAADPRFNNRVGRNAHRDALFPILEEAFAKKPWAHWRAKFREAGIPSGRVGTRICSGGR